MIISIISIQSGFINYDSLEKGCGGSETWALQISEAFVKLGHSVLLFTNTEEYTNHIEINNNLSIIHYQFINEVYNKVDINFTIILRQCPENIINIIRNKSVLYLQCHDLFATEKMDYSAFNKIICLTEYHIDAIRKTIKEDISKFHIIPNGIDLDLFKDIDISKKDNRILWCSNPDRGLYIILNNLYQNIKKYIPDFGIDVCYPNYSSLMDVQDLFKDKDIRFLGSLSKKDLYKEMSKHKVWIYPQNFIDTFCIGVLENTMCNVDIVCPWIYGPGDIFDKSIINIEKIDVNEDTKSSMSFYPFKYDLSQESSNKILVSLFNSAINKINNFDAETNVNERNLKRNFVINNYQWTDIAKSYLNLYRNDMLQKERTNLTIYNINENNLLNED